MGQVEPTLLLLMEALCLIRCTLPSPSRALELLHNSVITYYLPGRSQGCPLVHSILLHIIAGM